VVQSKSSNVGSYIGKYYVTTYYTPVRNQKKYVAGSYRSDYKINCWGDCLLTASEYKLKHNDAFKILACPSSFKFGTKLRLETSDGVIIAQCEDRGGAIKGKRLDLWAGIGDDAWIGRYSGYAKVHIIK